MIWIQLLTQCHSCEWLAVLWTAASSPWQGTVGSVCHSWLAGQAVVEQVLGELRQIYAWNVMSCHPPFILLLLCGFSMLRGWCQGLRMNVWHGGDWLGVLGKLRHRTDNKFSSWEACFFFCTLNSKDSRLKSGFCQLQVRLITDLMKENRNRRDEGIIFLLELLGVQGKKKI